MHVIILLWPFRNRSFRSGLWEVIPLRRRRQNLFRECGRPRVRHVQQRDRYVSGTLSCWLHDEMAAGLILVDGAAERAEISAGRSYLIRWDHVGNTRQLQSQLLALNRT